MPPRLTGILVGLLAVVVAVGTVAMWVDFRHRVDRATAVDPAPLVTPAATPTTAGSPRPVVSLWIGDGYTTGSCGAAHRLGWRCRLDAERGTGFLSDGSVFDAGYGTLADRLADLPRHEPDVVVVDAGRNDLGVYATPALLAAMDDYLARLRDRYPDAVLVQVVPWTRADPTPDPDLTAAIDDLMTTYDGHALHPDGRVLQGAVLARALRDLDLPVAQDG